MTDKWLEVTTADGHMHCYLSEPDGAGPYPAVVVIQEAFGVDEYVRSVCDRLADAGYVALAPELFHRAGTHVELDKKDFSKVGPYITKVTTSTIEEDVGSAVAALRARPDVDPRRLAIMGFCLGGYAALLGGLTTAVAAVIAWYPGGVCHANKQYGDRTPLLDRLREMKPATLVHFGAEDQSIPEADQKAIKHALELSPSRHATIAWQGAGHAFHSHDRPDHYNPQAAEDAWHKSLDWLKTMLEMV